MKTLTITISVDWEGREINEDNLAIIEALRTRYPEIPYQHFLNAAYYTRGDRDHQELTLAKKRVVLDSDEHGLHIHPWHSLVVASGVTPRHKPTLFNDETPLKTYPGHSDWGHEICLDAFTTNELRQMIAKSREVLCSQGFRTPKSFRAGAWLAAPCVLEALVEEGFQRDCSGAWLEPLKGRWNDLNLYQRNQALWPNIDPRTQPYQIKTAKGDIWQYPNNASLADYIDADGMLACFHQSLDELAQQKTADSRFLSVGFHLETAVKYLNRIEGFVEGVLKTKLPRDTAVQFCL